MKIKYLLLIIGFVAFACNREKHELIIAGYEYKKAKTLDDSNNYILPVYDFHHDLIALKNSRLFMEAFDERNISLSGQNNPVIRLVVDVNGKKSLIMRIEDNKLIRKIYKSGNWLPDIRYDLLPKNEKIDYLILRYNLGLSYKILPDRIKSIYDSLSKLRNELKSEVYYNKLVEKATVIHAFDYSCDTFELSSEKYWKIIDSISNSNYKTLPVFDTVNCMDHYDSGGFYLEINTKERYAIVQQTYGCNRGSEFSKLCMFILSFAETKEDYKL